LCFAKCYLPYFQALAHSLHKNTGGWGTVARASAREPDTLVTNTSPASPSLSVACALFPSPQELWPSAFTSLASRLRATAGHSPPFLYPLSFHKFRRPPLLTPLPAHISEKHLGGGGTIRFGNSRFR
jgi:hypothetical protein